MTFSKVLGGLISAGASAINRYVNKDKDKAPISNVVKNNNTSVSPSTGNKSYAYDPQGNRHDTYLNNGVTTTTDGNRLQSGWTSQTAGGIYRVGDDGKGVKVESHNQYMPQKISNHISAKNYDISSGTGYLDFRNDSDARGSAIRNNLKNNQSINYGINKNDYMYEGTYGNTAPQDIYQMNQRKFHNEDEINSAVRPSHYRVGGRYGYSDNSAKPTDTDSYSKMVVKTPDGQYTTVDRAAAQYYADQGFAIIAPARGGYAWDIKEALRADTHGSDWKDDGYNNGNVIMRSPSGRHQSVDASSAQEYFDKGYMLDKTSQSINRALQSGYYDAVNSANSAIGNGDYNPNHSYSEEHGWDANSNGGAGGYKFSLGDGRGSYNQFGNSISRALGNYESSISRGTKFSLDEYGNAYADEQGNTNMKGKTRIRRDYTKEGNPVYDGNGAYYLTNNFGENIKVSEEVYKKYEKNEPKTIENTSNLSKGKSEVKEVTMPSGNTAYQEGGDFFITKPDGQKAKVSESEYQQYMMLEFGI